MSLGTLFVDEKPYPIQHIYLEAGLIMFRAHVHGPFVIPEDGELRIHDPQGGLVTVAPWRAKGVELEADVSATIEVPVSIDEVAGWPRTQKGRPVRPEARTGRWTRRRDQGA